ncbi:MAG: hypothetical protein OSA89_19360, partial [Mariniblastus sp.]|nr:hypothetical protein [Mariniblastus sp.]
LTLIDEHSRECLTIDVKRDKPFFIYVSHYAPHWPLQAKEEDIAPYRDLYKKHERATLMDARLKPASNCLTTT